MQKWSGVVKNRCPESPCLRFPSIAADFPMSWMSPWRSCGCRIWKSGRYRTGIWGKASCTMEGGGTAGRQQGWIRNVADLCRFFLVGQIEKVADGLRCRSGCGIILFLLKQTEKRDCFQGNGAFSVEKARLMFRLFRWNCMDEICFMPHGIARRQEKTEWQGMKWR